MERTSSIFTPLLLSIKHLFTNFIILFFLSIGPLCLSQEEIAIGEWKAYVSYNNSYDVAQSETNVYSASERGLLKVSKEDHVVEKITKAEGLNDTEPRKLVFDETTKTLVIAYLNGNIDLMISGEIINIPNIFINSNIIKSKAPIRARVDDSGHAYITYSFGVVQLNLMSFTFGFSLFTDFAVNDFIKYQDRFFISTDNGVYWAESNPSLNHADISTWTRYNNGWPVGYFSRSICATADRLYCDIDGSLYEITTGMPVLVLAAEPDYGIRQLSGLNNKLGASFQYLGSGFKIDQIFFLNPDGSQISVYRSSSCVVVVTSIVQDASGSIYYASESGGLKTSEAIGMGCAEIATDGPPNTDAFEVTFRGQDVIVASGEVGDDGTPSLNRNGIYTYIDGEWDQFNHKDGFFGDSVIDYTDVAVGPNDQLAIGSFFRGVIRATPGFEEVELLTKDNTCLDPQELLLGRTSVTDVTYDERGDLWISNFRALLPIKMIDRDGVCHSFPISRNFGTSDLTEIAIDQSGYKWIATFDASRGVVVFDEGEIDDPSDDRFVTLNNSNSFIQDNVVRDIKVDLDGDVWVGTDRGVVVFECAASIFTNGCGGRTPIVEVDGVPALLLENERVRAIAIDGANRKWFGTSNGVFVQSANGEEEVLRFDERNSPLISNFIRDIAINPATGEVFISTDKGLMSYRTDATDGGTIHADENNVYAYPNPVRPGYDGPIAIKGLPRDARVKITDIQGKLIFESEANGGQAIWNGRDYNGRRAASGVYLVFSTSQTSFEKPDALVSKILVVN